MLINPCVKVKRKGFSKFFPIISTLLEPQLHHSLFLKKRNRLLHWVPRSPGYGTQTTSSSLLTTSKDWSLHLPSFYFRWKECPHSSRLKILLHCFFDTIPFYPHSIIFSTIPQTTALLTYSFLSSNTQRSVSDKKINSLTSIS